ncbi:nucleoside 2-deoxyribosyltransferase domain-containing protein [Streptomyces sp. NPDC055966]|uniref:nucleoside 2-deoxyribosyltransferase domain-containing protein n=1 Tax=Streptomyces sp. NPDC055966 TaxID=3345669 RepID=UPI0035DBB18E
MPCAGVLHALDLRLSRRRALPARVRLLRPDSRARLGRQAHRPRLGWEYEHLRIVDVILFWFCSGAVQPIALYELGAHAARGTRLAVGVHPQYPRRLDVVEQLRHVRPDVTVHESLQATLRAAVALLPAAPPRP